MATQAGSRYKFCNRPDDSLANFYAEKVGRFGSILRVC